MRDITQLHELSEQPTYILVFQRFSVLYDFASDNVIINADSDQIIETHLAM